MPTVAGHICSFLPLLPTRPAQEGAPIATSLLKRQSEFEMIDAIFYGATSKGGTKKCDCACLSSFSVSSLSNFAAVTLNAMLRVGARICARAAFAQPPAAGVARTMVTHAAAPTSMRGVLAAGAVAVGGVAAWALHERKQAQVSVHPALLLFMTSPRVLLIGFLVPSTSLVLLGSS